MHSHSHSKPCKDRSYIALFIFAAFCSAKFSRKNRVSHLIQSLVKRTAQQRRPAAEIPELKGCRHTPDGPIKSHGKVLFRLIRQLPLRKPIARNQGVEAAAFVIFFQIVCRIHQIDPASHVIQHLAVDPLPHRVVQLRRHPCKKLGKGICGFIQCGAAVFLQLVQLCQLQARRFIKCRAILRCLSVCAAKHSLRCAVFQSLPASAVMDAIHDLPVGKDHTARRRLFQCRRSLRRTASLAGMCHTAAASCLLFLAVRKQHSEIGQIVVQDQRCGKAVFLPQRVAKPTVHGLKARPFFLRQFFPGGQHIAKHQMLRERTMV